MPYGATRERRSQAGRKHATRKKTCRCGRVIFGNAFGNHKAKCQRERPDLWSRPA